jgi:hypothetical protein
VPKSTDKKWLVGRNKTITGFCNGINKPAQCEGTRPRSQGKPLPVCHFFEDCPCECHKIVDEMFMATGLERQFMPNPDYTPEKGHWLRPKVEDPITGDDASGYVGPDTPDGVEHVTVTPLARTRPPLVERRTPLGYAGRGTLEAQVWECVTALGGEPDTKTVSEWIAEKYTIPYPSRGAIQAVWVRWDKMGFARLAKGPVRFAGFVGEGTWPSLERIKGSAKQQKKSAQARVRQGIRPPA